jgi:hypothetical protein
MQNNLYCIVGTPSSRMKTKIVVPSYARSIGELYFEYMGL